MHLIELYKSVQGESSFAGLPCIFVRLAGCNLRCAWCDSEYTFAGGKPFTFDEVEAQIKSLAPCTLIEFTGGEPMLQAKELIPLMHRLLAQNYTLLIETSGERPLDEVPKAVRKIVDVKCPGAGAAANTFRLENLAALTKNDEVKFVIGTRQDYEWAKETVLARGLAGICPVLFSWVAPLLERQQDKSLRKVPAGQTPISRQELVEKIMADALPVRFQLQMHKFIWPPDQKGV